MALAIQRWYLGPLIESIEMLMVSLIDTIPAPDTVLQDHSSGGRAAIFWEMLSLERSELSFYEKRVLLLLTQSPSIWSFVDTTPAPDTIFQEFFSLSKVHIPVFPDAKELDPGTTVFAGDMGFYVG